jgi:ribosomal protein L16/L10AE
MSSAPRQAAVAPRRIGVRATPAPAILVEYDGQWHGSGMGGGTGGQRRCEHHEVVLTLEGVHEPATVIAAALRQAHPNIYTPALSDEQVSREQCRDLHRRWLVASAVSAIQCEQAR